MAVDAGPRLKNLDFFVVREAFLPRISLIYMYTGPSTVSQHDEAEPAGGQRDGAKP